MRYEALRTEIPSLLIAACRPDGSDTLNATVIVDDAVVGTAVPTVAIELDPGEHVVRLTHEGWTAEPQRVVLREGEAVRRLSFRFVQVGTVAPSLPLKAPPPRALGVALTSLGSVMLAAGGVVLAAGVVEFESLSHAPCAATQTCSPSDVRTIKLEYGIGSAVAAVGVSALVVGIWALTRPRARSTATALPTRLALAF
jgi:hypothetical protein